MQPKDGSCYLCMKLHCDYGTKMAIEEHHVVFGTSGRALSEQYGLKVYLCPEHHRTGKEAAHQNHEIARILQKDSQKAFKRAYPELDFLEIFGINYLDEDDQEGAAEHSKAIDGFRFI